MPPQLITAFNGPRDYYELPLALHEMGLLQTHVSDLYLPDALAHASFLPAKLRSRHRSGLPSRRVSIDWHAARQHLSRPTGIDPYLDIDRSLSLTAAKLAKRTGAGLFLYSFYAWWAFQTLPTHPRHLYQFHPHAASTLALLEKDLQLYPEARWSFDNETDSQPLARQRQEALEEWKMADSILCASTFTKSSLVQQGCEPERIRVVPYGIFPQALERSIPAADTSSCRFLFVGQGVQRKGLHHLLHAWKRAALRNAELTIVARKLDPGLVPLLDQPGITHRANITAEELQSLYDRASAFVMPSIVEGFGLVYLEALAAGLHCIGTVNTGLPDLHLPPECVSIVPPGDIERLAEALTITRDNAQQGRLNRQRIRAAVAPLTWDYRRAEMRQAIAAMLQHS